MRLKHRLTRLAQLAGAAALLVGGIAGAWLGWTYHGPAAPVQVYRGITYSCERLPQTSESGGLLHLVKVDLSVPGVRFFLTPLDPAAVSAGWQYRLAYVSDVVRRRRLAVGVNGTLFYSADPFYFRLSGDKAHGVETLVADHVVSHVWQHTYLLWWDDRNIAHLERSKPPSEQVLAAARWGIGGQYPLLLDGKMPPGVGHAPDQRTMIAANPQQRLVWLACFDRASYAVAGRTLAAKGATLGILVDGGWSCSMALGPEAAGVRGGRVSGCWRPVANVFGFYAEPIASHR